MTAKSLYGLIDLMSLAEIELPVASETDLPEGWIEVALDTLLTSLESGSRPSGGVRGIAEGIPSVGGEHLNDDGGFRFENVKYVPKAFHEKMFRGHIRRGDVLVVKDGATTGKVSYIDDTFPYSSAVVNEHVFICRVAPAIDSRFVFRFLHSEEGQRRILENFRGSAQGGINQGFAPNTAIPLPPLAEQQRIVAKLEQVLAAASTTRERLARVPALMKRFRQSVLAAACSGRLTADWRDTHPNTEPASKLLERILAERRARGEAEPSVKKRNHAKIAEDNLFFTKEVGNNAVGPLTFNESVSGLDDATLRQFTRQFRSAPFGYKEPTALDTGEEDLDGVWKSLTLQDVIKEPVKNGYSAKPVAYETPYRVLTLTATTSGVFSAKHFKYFDEYISDSSHFWLQPNDILVQRGNTIEYVGVPAIYNGASHQFIYPDLMIRIRARNGVLTKFLYYVLSWEKTRNYLRENATGTAGNMPKINQRALLSVSVPLPSTAEQQEIVWRVEKLFKLAATIENRTAAAAARSEKLTQAVLARAFRGELVPTEAELARAEGRDYEPASALLERMNKQQEMRKPQHEKKRPAKADDAQKALALPNL